METPTKESFESWVQLVTKRPAEDAVREYEQAIETDPTNRREPAEKFMAAMYADYDAIFEASKRHEVHHWLHREVGFQRATQKMFRHKGASGIARSERIERAVSELLAYDSERYHRYVRSWASDRARFLTLSRSWTGRVSEAVHEYLYVDHDARHAASVEATSNLQKISALLEKVRPFIEREVDYGRALDVVERNIDRITKKTEELRPERDQKNKAEHVFVRRVARISQHFSGNWKIRPVVVDNLQTISAIRHQFDIRTIHRICKELTEEDKKRDEIARAKETARTDAGATTRLGEK